MNFGQMRAIVKTNIFDFSGSAFTADELKIYVNQAMHHISSLIAVVDQHLMMTKFEGPINNPANEHFVVQALDPAQNPKARRIISAQRTDGGITSDDISLKIMSFKDAQHESTGAGLDKPPIFLFNQDFGFVRPVASGTQVRVYYVQVLPNMFADTDTPGQANGAPIDQVNALPLQYHGLITSCATLLALAAENAPLDQWQPLYVEQATACGLEVNLRGRTQESKNVHGR